MQVNRRHPYRPLPDIPDCYSTVYLPTHIRIRRLSGEIQYPELSGCHGRELALPGRAGPPVCPNADQSGESFGFRSRDMNLERPPV